MIHHGDCLEVMAAMEPESVDAIVTDPPYGLEFMGRSWDKLDDGYNSKRWDGRRTVAEAPSRDPATPGGRHAASVSPSQPNPKCATCGHYKFSGTPCRCEVPVWIARPNEQARRMTAWHQRWAEAAYRVAKPSAYLLAFGGTRTVHRMTVALEDAGWIIRDMLVWAYASGFPKSKASLKPAWEPIVMARKPGPLRMLAIDECRIPAAADDLAGWHESGREPHKSGATWKLNESQIVEQHPAGRWPANVILTATEWYTLRDDVGQVPRDLIVSYFEAQGVGVDDVPRVRQGVRDHASVGAGRSAEILLPAVQLEGFAGGEADGDAAHPGVEAADERQPDGQGNRPGVARLEGRTLVRPSGLRERGGVGTDGADAGASGGDGPEDRQGTPVHPGAPAGDGDEAGPPARESRGSASPQRGEGRQLAGQPVPPGPVESQPGAPAGGSGTGAAPRARGRAGGGERSVTVPLALIPSGWLPYFRFSHDTGIFDGGVEGVVGGGETQRYGPSTRGAYTNPDGNIYGGGKGYVTDGDHAPIGYDHGEGTYSRFFLIPKADRSDREPVLGGLPLASRGTLNEYARPSEGRTASKNGSTPRANVHPTVKPTELMRHLVRLVTPTGGTILDPFLGSGTTGLACELEGFPWIGIEKEAEYVAIAEARLNGTQRGLGLAG